MAISYPPLQLEDDGRVFDLCADAYIGHIDEPYPDAEQAAKWDWLRQEYEDAQRFAAGCRAAAEDGYRDHIGNPR